MKYSPIFVTQTISIRISTTKIEWEIDSKTWKTLRRYRAIAFDFLIVSAETLRLIFHFFFAVIASRHPFRDLIEFELHSLRIRKIWKNEQKICCVDWNSLIMVCKWPATHRHRLGAFSKSNSISNRNKKKIHFLNATETFDVFDLNRIPISKLSIYEKKKK